MKALLSVLLVCMGIFIGSLMTMITQQPPPPKYVVTQTAGEDCEIMVWVVQHMFPNTTVIYNVPLTRRLTKRDIGFIYCSLLGEDCDKEKQENIAGLFDHMTEIIYVPDDLGERQAKISLAHEFVHYVQHYRDGSIHRVAEPLQKMVHDQREVEAYEIDNIFEIKFYK